MNRPYIICHMMISVDGRIDCDMTSKLPGVNDYYTTLNDIDVPTTVSGRVTAELEMSEKGEFIPKNKEVYGKEGFSKKADANGYEVVVDTKGKLLWPDASGMEKPYLIITGTNVTKEYLEYLDSRNISWIVCGKDEIDLARAAEILSEQFNVKRMGIVGGSKINTAFLKAGLLDEISILIGAGIDGRGGMPAVFDGLEMSEDVVRLELIDVKKYESNAVWVRYKC
ncbi:dihydrofolate reductase family protein [Eubacterium sp. MSJ-13]|uniref:RibD family protein n=1 Tax=Eubacterium sp. MSJ-13 TaxID=2841513 RepID=UPI001C12573C|nr:dihydrofolate reductase family protein [Eubacterium sp. MSJ-13]MBU5478006.1 dihydrofolate reductase family protein [Eubacterium sp. MSJ-13]